MRERSRVLTGTHRAGRWCLRLRQPATGGPASVELDWAWALEREEAHGDVLGFYHTHPGKYTLPSARDVATMRAWVSCFGKPLLCVIEADGAMAAYLFESDADAGQRLPAAEKRGAWLTVEIGQGAAG